MADPERDLMAVPRLADEVGVTPRVIRYWEEQGILNPTREHGKLRYSPRDRAIARLIKRLMDAGFSVDEVRMLRTLAEREIRTAARIGDDAVLREAALRVLYQRKAFREATGMDEERFPDGPEPRDDRRAGRSDGPEATDRKPGAAKKHGVKKHAAKKHGPKRHGPPHG